MKWPPVFLSQQAGYEAAYPAACSPDNKAQYSLDCDDGIEYSACLHEPTPAGAAGAHGAVSAILWNALNSLPGDHRAAGSMPASHPRQELSGRLLEAEGVDESAVRRAVRSVALETMKKYLRKYPLNASSELPSLKCLGGI